MKTDLVSKIVLFLCIALFLFLSFFALQYRGKASRDILLDDTTPDKVLTAIHRVFPQERLRCTADLHLEQFLKGSTAAFAYDVHALPLVHSNEQLRFYPLYTDCVVIALDADQVPTQVNGWEDLKTITQPVSFLSAKPELIYIWAALSHGYSGALDQNAISQSSIGLGSASSNPLEGTSVPKYLSSLHQQDRLLWDDSSAPVQVTLLSKLSSLQKEGRALEVVFPKEGTLSLDGGLLTTAILSEEQIALLQNAYADSGFLPCGSLLENKTILPAATILDAFTGFNWPEKALYREVLQQRQFIPADTEELHVSSVLLILLLTIFSVEAKKRVLHKGVRLGLYFTGVLLIGWIGLSIFKYSLFGYPVLERLCWYLFYFFMLPLPVLSLYIAQNADHTERNLLSLRVKLAGILAFAFFLLVITNDLHHLVFFFPAGEGRYTYQMGYYLLSGFFLLTQFGAFFVMLKKSWDSPKRKMTIFPAGITLLGLLYCIAYNTGHPTLSKLSLPLGMSLLVLSFWSSAFFSGLIHANRSYRSLFAHSSLDMQILDLNGQVHFRTANATPLPETFVPRSVLQKYSILLPEEEKLLWTTPIHGGLVMIKENIGEISRLRKKLGQLNRQRKRENQTLTQQEQVKQKLSLIKTQNLLTAEVNAVVQDKVREMLSLLPSLEGPLSTKKISQTKLYLLSFYCKRRCELLLREKQEADYPPQSLLHLLQEITAVMPGNILLSLDVHQPTTVAQGILLYEAYSSLLYLLAEEEQTAEPARLAQVYIQEDNLFLRLMTAQREDKLFQCLQGLTLHHQELSLEEKDLEDAISLTLKIQKGGSSHA